jgi:hypothetical protein
MHDFAGVEPTAPLSSLTSLAAPGSSASSPMMSYAPQP